MSNGISKNKTKRVSDNNDVKVFTKCTGYYEHTMGSTPPFFTIQQQQKQQQKKRTNKRF